MPRPNTNRDFLQAIAVNGVILSDPNLEGVWVDPHTLMTPTPWGVVTVTVRKANARGLAKMSNPPALETPVETPVETDQESSVEIPVEAPEMAVEPDTQPEHTLEVEASESPSESVSEPDLLPEEDEEEDMGLEEGTGLEEDDLGPFEALARSIGRTHPPQREPEPESEDMFDI
jgi:hypothetical protein